MATRAYYFFPTYFLCLLTLISYPNLGLAKNLVPENLLSWQTTPSELQVQLKSPAIELGDDGSVTAPQTVPDTIAGNPELPVQFLKFALPTKTDLNSLEIRVTSLTTFEFPQSIEVRPAPPLVQYREPQQSQDQAAIIEKNPEVYERNTFYPDTPIFISDTGHLGPYPYVTLKFYPFQYLSLIHI